MEIIRATHLAQQAGAYYVRIQGMARQHHISLQEEFDEHDSPETKYIVVMDEYLPIATCRIYAIDPTTVMLGRIVVLPEYRRQGLGTRVVREAEKWAKELGYKEIKIDSRLEAIDFYAKLGYKHIDDSVIRSGTFDCVKMNKNI